MTTQELLSIRNGAVKAAEARDPVKAEIAALKKANAEQAQRIQILMETITGLEAERDNWRKQALEEDARANAVTDEPQAKRRSRKPKGS